MKNRLFLPFAWAAGLLMAIPAHAHSDNATTGMIVGGVAGAIIGEHNHHRAGQGALIGAATGLVLGAIVDANQDHERETCYTQRTYSPRHVTVVSPRCEQTRVVVVSRPCPPPPRKVVIVESGRPYCGGREVYAGHRHHHRGHRDVVVVKPSHRDRSWDQDDEYVEDEYSDYRH